VKTKWGRTSPTLFNSGTHEKWEEIVGGLKVAAVLQVVPYLIGNGQLTVDSMTADRVLRHKARIPIRSSGCAKAG